jgi:CDP-diacylglycerol pyrophosphatase
MSVQLHKYQAKKGNQSELEQENKLLVEKIIKAQEKINELELKVEQTQEKNKQLTLAIRHQLEEQTPIIIDNEFLGKIE